MNNAWMDVTTILTWNRPAVGIIRTEAECAAYILSLQASDKKLRFCAFDMQSGYVEVSAANVQSALNRISGKNETAPSASPVLNVIARTSMRDTGLKLLDKLPQGLRSHLYLYLRRRRKSIAEGYHASVALKRSLKEFLRPAGTAPTMLDQQVAPNNNVLSHPFQIGDTYLSMGLDWDQKDLTTLYRIKKLVSLKVILFCYDVIPVTHPHLCVGDVSAKFANYFSKVAWCADTVLCISECSKTDLTRLLLELGTPIPNMRVIKLGSQKSSDCVEPIDPAVNVLKQQKFILFVSTIERRKNHEVLYRAYTRLIDRGVSNIPQLVFVGMPGWGVSDLLSDLKLDPRVQGKITILNNVNDDSLAWLYKNCWFTAFPSLYEGWGLPVVESLAAGKFCLASSAASIPEAGEDYIEYLDPWDVESWASKLQEYIERPDLVEEFQARISRDYQQTTWSEAASQIVSSISDRYESIASTQRVG